MRASRRSPILASSTRRRRRHCTPRWLRCAAPVRFGPCSVRSRTTRSHSGLFIAFAEIAVGIGIALGLLTRVAAFGGMVLALSLWLTVSWGAEPWYTSADLAYLFAFTPAARLAGAGGVVVARRLAGRHKGTSTRHRRGPVPTGRPASAALRSSAECAGGRGDAVSVARRASRPRGRRPRPAPAPGRGSAGDDSLRYQSAAASRSPTRSPGTRTWILQLSAGQFTAYDAVCPHQGLSRDVRLRVQRFPLPVPRLDLCR